MTTTGLKTVTPHIPSATRVSDSHQSPHQNQAPQPQLAQVTPAPTLFEDQKPQNVSEIKPKITVVGVGGAGGNAVNNMIRSQLKGVRFVVCNTDAQALDHSLCDCRIQLGSEATQGLGAGSSPDVGRIAAEESINDFLTEIETSNMIFITAGMGGGTGTGAAPVIAKNARERGILTVAVVTKPFHFEGKRRMTTADQGIEELTQYVDTLIIIPNQNLFRVATEKTTFADAFKMADDVLYSGVRGVTDLMMMPGLINLDFADIRAVMSQMGKAMMGTGEASGEGRAVEAAEAAISNPLLDDVSMKGAGGVLINITGGLDMTLFEVDEAANRIREEVDSEANIIFGSTFDEKMSGVMRVSVVATGIEAESASQRFSLRTADEQLSPEENAWQEEGEDASESQDFSQMDGDMIEETTQENQEGDLNDDEVPLSAVARDDHEAPHKHPSQTPKKGFFSRLADTVRGVHKEEPAPQTVKAKSFYDSDPSSHKSYTQGESLAEATPIKPKSEPDPAEFNEIPAYMRRKSSDS